MDRQRYRDLFLSESREHLDAAHELLGRLEDGAGDSGVVRELMRHAHSLKGMAATMGYRSIVALAHAMEDLFEVLRNSAGAAATTIDRLNDGVDCLDALVGAIAGGDESSSHAADALAEDLRQLAVRASTIEVSRPAGPPSARRSTGAAPKSTRGDLRERRWRLSIELCGNAARTASGAVRAIGHLAALGPVESVASPILEGSPPQYDGRLEMTLVFKGSAAQVEEAVCAIPGIESCEVHPLPRGRRETPVDEEQAVPHVWTRVRADLLDFVAEQTLDLMLEQARARSRCATTSPGLLRHLDRSEFLLKQLHGTVMELRLVPFDFASYRLQRSVRQLTRELNRQVRLRIEGADVRLDRSLLEALMDPLQHLVRNAVDHGLESPEERRGAGKPSEGSLILTLERHGDQLRIALQDDGRGLSPHALRREAIARGFLDRQQASALDDREALMLATLPALSTASRVTSVSGRGVGLDVVRECVEALGGHLSIRSSTGAGTCVEMNLPLDLALIQALLVRVGGELFAIPLFAVHRTFPMDGGSPEDRVSIPEVGDLARRLGIETPERRRAPHRIGLLVQVGSRKVGWSVEEILGRREIVVRPLGPPLDNLRQFAGAALLDDGAIALVLDPAQV